MSVCVSSDLSEKKSDLRVCDDASCRYGGVCRDDGAQLKCVCQFQVRTPRLLGALFRPGETR